MKEDIWITIYYGLMKKRTHISRRNLVEMELNKILPEECWVTEELCDEIDSIMGRRSD